MILAYVFFRKFNELCGNFSRVGLKKQIVGNFENIFKKFPRKIATMHYFSIFSKIE